jgi:uncharacterized protein YjbJ (UPF0337 family)
MRNTQLESKRHVVVGTLNQAKGFLLELFGKLTNNKKARRIGKKDRVIGSLQKSLGNSWPIRHKNLFLTFTTMATIMAALVYYVKRANEEALSASSEAQLYGTY